MKKALAFLLALLLSCQITTGAAGLSVSDSNDTLHKVFAHDRALEHHHHIFSAHFEINSSEINHSHADDNCHSSDLITTSIVSVFFHSATTRTALALDRHPDVVLDGLLRPPQARA